MVEFFKRFSTWIIVGAAILVGAYLFFVSGGETSKKLTNALIGVAAVLGLGFGGKWLLGGGLKGLSDKEKKKQTQEDIDANEADFENESKKNQATLTKAQMRSIANGLESAMIGTYFNGTFEDDVYAEIKKIKNDTDWTGVVAAFGKRDYSNADGEITFSSDLRDLYFWLKSDLSVAEKNKVNKILAGNGVTYQV